MKKTDKIKQLKTQITKLQKELEAAEAGTAKFKIYWTDKTYCMKHVTTVEAKTAAAAKRIFKNRKLNYVKWDGGQNDGPWKETVEYTVNRVTAVQAKAKKAKPKYDNDRGFGRGGYCVQYDGARGG